MTQEAISSYETGRVMPSADILIKLADYFDTNIDYLLCRTNYNLPIANLKPSNINEQQFKLLLKINKLSKNDMSKVEGYVDGLISKQNFLLKKNILIYKKCFFIDYLINFFIFPSSFIGLNTSILFSLPLIISNMLLLPYSSKTSQYSSKQLFFSIL